MSNSTATDLSTWCAEGVLERPRYDINEHSRALDTEWRPTSTRQSCLFALGRVLLLGPASGFRVQQRRNKHLNFFLTRIRNSQNALPGYVRDDFDCPMTSHQVGHRDSRKWVATIAHSAVECS